MFPDVVAAGGPAFTLLLYGTNFDAKAVVRWNETPLVTTVQASTTLLAQVPASLIAAAGRGIVTVTNPDGRASPPIAIRITTGPLLTGCAPFELTVGSPAVTIVCRGVNFLPGAKAYWQDTPLPTTFISSAELSVTVPGSLLAKPGQFWLLVMNPNGETTGLAAVYVNLPPVPGKPAISELRCGSLVLGGGPTSITLRGSNFVPGSVIRFGSTNLPTTFGNATQLEATLPASAITFAGYANVTVVNPDGLTSNSLTAEVIAPPLLDFLSPTSAAAPGPALTLTVNGRAFSRQAAIQWNDFLLETVYLSDTQLTAYIPASYLTAPGAVAVRVRNGFGAVSSPRVFTLTRGGSPIVAIANVSAPGVVAGSPGVTVTVDGSGFVSGSTVVWEGVTLATNRIGPNQLEAYLPARLFSTWAGIHVLNPDGSGSSTWMARVGPTTITSLAPEAAVAGGTFAGLLATGIFAPGTVLRWNGIPLTTAQAGNVTQLTADVPSSFLAAPGVVSITAVAPNGAASPPTTFRLTSPTAVLTLAAAGELMAGDPSSVLTLTGSGFLSGAVVTWNSTPLSTSFVSSTQLQAVLPAPLIASPGQAQVRVLNPEAAASNTTIVQIPALAIHSISPSSALAGGPAFSLTVTGSFKSGTLIEWNGIPLSTTFVNATKLTAAVPASRIASGGAVSIIAVNPGGASSSSTAFQITSPPASVLPGGVVNAADGQARIAPGSLISIYASRLPTLNASAESTPLPLELGGVSARINGIPAPLLFVGESQINAQVPFEVPPGQATLVLSAGPVASDPVRFEVRPAGPGILTIPTGSHAVAQNAVDFQLNSAENPARPGEYVILYLVGQGLVLPPVLTGAAAPTELLSFPVATVEATLGEQPATVAFAGLAPGMVGVLQVNLLVPAGASGEAPVRISIGGEVSPPAILSIAQK